MKFAIYVKVRNRPERAEYRHGKAPGESGVILKGSERLCQSPFCRSESASNPGRGVVDYQPSPLQEGFTPLFPGLVFWQNQR